MTMSADTPLAARACVPCRGGVPPLKGADLDFFAKELGHDWQVVEEHHLEKAFSFDDWAGAITFTNRVSDIAEEQNHHPDVLTSWGKVTVTIWTHKIDGLTESDFIFAAKVQEVYGT
jgi:4a-hydroxytetrahydrobiopterin dehydratase